MDPASKKDMIGHYSDLLELHGPTPEALAYRSAEQQSIAADPVNTIRVSLARRRSRCPAFASAEH